MPPASPSPPPSSPPQPGSGAAFYFVLAFAISWGGVLAIVGWDGFPGAADEFASLLPAVVLAMLAGPSLAGLAATGFYLGVPGLRDLWRRFLKFRAGFRPWAFALLTAPLAVAGVLAALSLLSPVYRPGFLTAGDPLSHLAVGLLTGLVAGFFEEIGWTGFAVPRLRRRFGPGATGLIAGLAWGAWHLLVVFWGSTPTVGLVPMAVYLPAMAFSFLVPYRLLMVRLYDRTGSLLLAMAMHGSLTASVRVFDPVPISGWPIVAYNLTLGAVFWLLAAGIAIASPGSLRAESADSRR